MILVPGSVKGKGGGEVFVSKPTRLMDGQFVFARPRTRDRSHKSQLTAQAARSQSSCHCQQLLVGPPGPTPLLIMDGSVNGRNRDGNISSPVISARQLLYKTSRAPEEKSSVLPSLPSSTCRTRTATANHTHPITTAPSASPPRRRRLPACTTFFLISLFLRCHPPSTEGREAQESPSRSRPPSLLTISSDLVRILFLPPCSSFPCWYLCSDVNYGYHSH